MFVAAAALLAACAPEDASSPDVAATINGEEIPISLLEERFEAIEGNPQFAEQVAQDESGEFEDQVQAELLTVLIRSEVLEQGAAEMGIEPTDEDIEAKRAEVVEEVGGDEAFEEVIETNNLTEETVQDQIRELALQDLVAEELTADLDVDEDEVQTAYDQTYGTASARHILLETEEAAQQARQRLEEGEDFGELAQELSTDPSAADNAGDLGEFTRGQMVPEFSEAVFDAEEGDILGPVETDFGFHIIEVQAVDEGPPLSEVEDELRDQLLEGERSTIVGEWLTEQLEEAEITVNPRFGEWDAEQGVVTPPGGALDEDEGADGGADGDTAPPPPPPPAGDDDVDPTTSPAPVDPQQGEDADAEADQGEDDDES